MSSAVASKLGAGCWGEADDESSRAAPLGFLVGWWLRDEIGVFSLLLFVGWSGLRLGWLFPFGESHLPPGLLVGLFPFFPLFTG
jgi:hypothetical protein